MRKLAVQVAAGDLAADAITPELISAAVCLADLPEPDLFIRTGGDQRISNFLLWQLAYTELWFTPVLWRSEEHTSELQSLMRISYAVFCLKKKNNRNNTKNKQHNSAIHEHGRNTNLDT